MRRSHSHRGKRQWVWIPQENELRAHSTKLRGLYTWWVQGYNEAVESEIRDMWSTRGKQVRDKGVRQKGNKKGEAQHVLNMRQKETGHDTTRMKICTHKMILVWLLQSWGSRLWV